MKEHEDDAPTRVRVEPLGLILELREGETLMQAAHRAGYWWPTTCEGSGTCTRCHIRFDPSDADAFGPMGSWERENLLFARGEIEPDVRLACQVRVVRDVVVRKLGVRRAEE